MGCKLILFDDLVSNEHIEIQIVANCASASTTFPNIYKFLYNIRSGID